MRSPTADVQFLTPREAGALLRLSAKQVMRLAAAGELPGRDLRTPGTTKACWRFERNALVAWLVGPQPTRLRSEAA